jgi:hypothetical protein
MEGSILYETEVNRSHEELAARAISLQTGCHVVLTSTASAIDFLIVKGDGLYAVAEFKKRNSSKDQYTTLTIDKQKIDKLVDVAFKLKVRPVLFIQWEDGPIYHAPVGVGYPTIKQTLRNVRDSADIDDLVYQIPISDFKELK